MDVSLSAAELKRFTVASPQLGGTARIPVDADCDLLYLYTTSRRIITLDQTMSFSPSPSLPFSRTPFTIPAYTGLGTSPPPPPPPKPGSHEQSRLGTPLSGPPLPVPPGVAAGPGTGSPVADGANAPTMGKGSAGEGQGQGQGQNIPPPVQPPTIKEGWLPDVVKDKSTADLQSILSNPSLLSSLTSTHPSHTSSLTTLSTALANNTSLAKHLLALESDLSSLRASTESLLLQHQSLDLAWRKKQAEVDAALEPWSPKALYQRLIAGIAEQEAVVGVVQDSFLEGGFEGDADGDGKA
ncbi:Protein OS-9, partial [Ascosphaera pollenicola]